MTVKAIDVLTMTGCDLLNHLEDLGRACSRIAQDWEKPSSSSTMPSSELDERMAKKWSAIAGVLVKARNEVYDLVQDENHRESCGA